MSQSFAMFSKEESRKEYFFLKGRKEYFDTSPVDTQKTNILRTIVPCMLITDAKGESNSLLIYGIAGVP